MKKTTMDGLSFNPGREFWNITVQAQRQTSQCSNKTFWKGRINNKIEYCIQSFLGYFHRQQRNVLIYKKATQNIANLSDVNLCYSYHLRFD